MYKIIKTLLITAVLSIPTFSQVKVPADGNNSGAQIEGFFTFHPNQDKIFNTDGYGGGIEFRNSFGQYIKLLQKLEYEKSTNGDVTNNFQQRDITFQSTVRLYPIEEYYSVKPFVQGGIRARFNKFKASSIIQLPVSPGFVTTDQKNTFTSPFVGVGLNIKDYYIVDYSHLFPDFSSKMEFFNGQPNFFRERGDVIQAKGFIPIGHKFLFTPTYQLSRTRFEFFPYVYDHKLTFGLTLKIK